MYCVTYANFVNISSTIWTCAPFLFSSNQMNVYGVTVLDSVKWYFQYLCRAYWLQILHVLQIWNFTKKYVII